jgi:hypothetical protein
MQTETFYHLIAFSRGLNEKAEFSDGMFPMSVVLMGKKSAYVTFEIFMDWLKNYFTPRKNSWRTLLILNSHASYINSWKMLELEVKNDILLLRLPSHTTHYFSLQTAPFFNF